VKKTIAAAILFTSMISFADQLVVCANLKAIEELSKMETESYVVRNYRSVTGEYLRLVSRRIYELADEAYVSTARSDRLIEVVSASYALMQQAQKTENVEPGVVGVRFENLRTIAKSAQTDFQCR
jgi:hypothetical protein